MEPLFLASFRRRSSRASGLPTSKSLHVEALEQRRLLHAGHDHDEPLTFPALEGTELIEVSTALNPLSSIPALNSLLGAAASVFLDFDGFFEANWGSYHNITTPAFDTDDDPTTFSDGELTAIENIWARVAEDYVPFKVNVTTVQPPSFANGVAVRAAIGGNGSWAGGSYGGIAYVNSFTNSIPNTVYVFPDNLGGGYAKYVAEATSHEVGHSFGLQHQSSYNAAGQLVSEYYSGPGNGTAPIMGNSYGATRGLWWYGTSTSASTFQDDMAVISKTQNGFGYRADDHGDSAATATPLAGSGQLQAAGIITKTSDVDYFSFDTTGGQVTLSVTVPASINNLDSKLELRTSTGQLITSAAPSNSFNATITTNLSAGSYRAVVASQGNYGDVGQYTLTANVPGAGAASEVLARRLFYNQSAFDLNNAAISSLDDWAIAVDKTAYLPGGGLITPASVSSYSRGINGIMVDLGGAHGSISGADFTFQVGANNSPAAWTAAPAPSSIAVRSGAGTSGSDRIEITWANNAIQNTYLRVVVEGNDAAGGFNSNTGLAASDVFYFGNLIGDSFASTTPTLFQTNTSDAANIFGGLTGGAAIDNVHDYNRSGDVTSADAVLVFGHLGTLTRINIGGSPSAPEGGDSETLFAAVWAPDAAPDSTALVADSIGSVKPASLEAAATERHSGPNDTTAAYERALAEAIDEIAELGVFDDELLDALTRLSA